MFLPEIKESGNFQIEKIVYYPERNISTGAADTCISGYFELSLECEVNKESRRIDITIFDSELEKLTRTKFAFE